MRHLTTNSPPILVDPANGRKGRHLTVEDGRYWPKAAFREWQRLAES